MILNKNLLNFFLKLYTISRNGRLNFWECDTRLDGLIKQTKPEPQYSQGTETDELENKNNKDQLDESSTANMEITDENEEKRLTILYTKKSK